jgi:hypothetical protein
MKVKNVKGTSNNNCSCTSWLKHWEKTQIKQQINVM